MRLAGLWRTGGPIGPQGILAQVKAIADDTVSFATVGRGRGGENPQIRPANVISRTWRTSASTAVAASANSPHSAGGR